MFHASVLYFLTREELFNVKIQCEHCGENLTKTVRTAFACYDAGPLECPHCHALQSRSLTEIDFLMDQLLTLLLILGLILLLPALMQVRSELLPLANLISLGGGILLLDQFRLFLYHFSPSISRPLSPQAQLSVKNRFNALRLNYIGILVLIFMDFNKPSVLYPTFDQSGSCQYAADGSFVSLNFIQDTPLISAFIFLISPVYVRVKCSFYAIFTTWNMIQ